MPFGECEGLLAALTIFVGKLPRGYKRQRINQLVTYSFGTPLKLICQTNHYTQKDGAIEDRVKE